MQKKPDEAQYRRLYQQSIEHPAEFWAGEANRLITWFKPWHNVIQGDWSAFNVQWFSDGKLNASYNCIDRHLPTRGNQTAIIWQGNEPSEIETITYQTLHHRVSQFANVLSSLGIKKGDRVAIYLPMIPEAAIAMLACARIGAIHSVIFGGFSSEALKMRILDADCRLLITADAGLRGEKKTFFKRCSDEALNQCPGVKHVIVVNRLNAPIEWRPPRDIWYHEAMASAAATCPPETMDAIDPLFILYTSGSTGAPKGVLHGTGGYLVYVASTHQHVFNIQPNEIHWCTADVGWITGHSYAVYGPLIHGGTTLLFEGVPHYPTFSRYWEIIDQHHVNTFYTAPTAIRTLRKEGEQWIHSTHRNSLKLLGTVGEPIDKETWLWYFNVIGKQRCPIVNTWWQTETGGIMLTQLPEITPSVAGSVGWPFFGIVPDIVDDQGKSVHKGHPGKLVIKHPWPGLMQTLYGNRERFLSTYFTPIPGAFYTGDGAFCSTDDHYWITGRNDDVIKVSGHRIGTGEVENALITHPCVAEAAIVGIADDIKGESIYAFVTLKSNIGPSDDLKKALIEHVRSTIGPLASPERIQWAIALPKTRSGKIMRRILRKIACREFDSLGDTSTLADESVVLQLIKDRQ